MDNLVSINHTKENTLKFNLSIEGINPSDIVAKFVIHSENMELGFLCGRQNGDEWTVTIPALPVLECTAYPFHFDVVADGYHFEPLRGTVNVVGTNNINISTPKKPKIVAEIVMTEEKKEQLPTVEEKKVTPAEPALPSKMKIDIKKGEKDDAVRAILEQTGIDPKILRQHRFSIKDKN